MHAGDENAPAELSPQESTLLFLFSISLDSEYSKQELALVSDDDGDCLGAHSSRAYLCKAAGTWMEPAI